MHKPLRLFMLSALLALAAPAATLRVDPSGAGDHVNLASAFAAADDGDSILLAPGSYAGPNNRNLSFGERNLSVIGEAGRDATLLDLQGQGRAFILNGQQDRRSLIQGLSFSKGQDVQGGAVVLFNASALLRDCAFHHCQAAQGGGLYAQGQGEPGLLEDCLFESNEGDYGGGLYASGVFAPDLEGCVFRGNEALFGGGLYLTNSAAPSVAGCWVEDNRAAQNGGGAYLQVGASPAFGFCTFVGNESPLHGGAAYLFNGAEPSFFRCSFALNEAADGGCLYLFLDCHATLEQNVFAWAGAGGVMTCLGSTPLATHNLAWESGTHEPFCGAYSDNLYLNPRFCGVIENRDFRLRSDSPCLPQSPDNPWDLPLGAWDEDCGPQAAGASSWSQLKARY